MSWPIPVTRIISCASSFIRIEKCSEMINTRHPLATENHIRLAQLPRWATLIAGMIGHLKLLGGLLVGVFRSHAARQAEIAFLRQQLVVLQRSAPARLRLRTADRLIFVWLYRLFPSVLAAAVVL